MGCRKITMKKVMASVRRQYPSYGLERRKKIARAIIYRRKWQNIILEENQKVFLAEQKNLLQNN